MKPGVRFWLMVGVLVGATALLHVVSHGEAVPLARPLARFPSALGTWHGRDLPLEPRIVAAVGVDDYLSRVYQGPDLAPLFLYIGYYKSQRSGKLIHSPKNCLPAAGWEPVRAGRANLVLPDGRSAPVNMYMIENGLERQEVVYWYHSHGRIIASEYWAKIYMVLDALRLNRTDGALVRIATPVGRDEPKARERSLEFAAQLVGRLQDSMPN
jgi:EpsI family protein